MTTSLTSARSDWASGHRAFLAAAQEGVTADRLHAQLEVLTDELRRRVGGTYTLDELVTAYGRSEDWARVALGEHAAGTGWERTLTISLDAAFHLYSRGAQDFVP
ncbi:MAG: hypothetical protein ACRC50_05135 [Gaiella sp.]